MKGSSEQFERQLAAYHIQNSPFTYNIYKNTIFVPVYPRGYVDQIVGIDYERRTVTARFVTYITICLRFDTKGREWLQKVKDYLKKHLTLEFPFNQIVMIPEIYKAENSPFMVKEHIDPSFTEDFVTYSVRGNIECPAEFDLMYFPYRRIEVRNNLCVRSQTFQIDGETWKVKYNSMMLTSENDRVHQFSPYFNKYDFGAFQVTYHSNEAVSDESEPALSKEWSRKQILDSLLVYLPSFKRDDKMWQLRREQADYWDRTQQTAIAKNIMTSFLEGRFEQQQDNHLDHLDTDEFSSFKHISFTFELTSYKLAFILKEEIPVWILVICSLFLFYSDTQIENRLANILLLLVSYITIFTSFRQNNVGQPSFTWYEFKLGMLMLIPCLTMITTTIDYYNPNRFEGRRNQASNPFFIASLALSGFFFLATLIFLIVVPIQRILQSMHMENRAHQNEEMNNWRNLVEEQWGHRKLTSKISDILERKRSDIIIYDPQIKKKISRAMSGENSPLRPEERRRLAGQDAIGGLVSDLLENQS